VASPVVRPFYDSKMEPKIGGLDLVSSYGHRMTLGLEVITDCTLRVILPEQSLFPTALNL
jgi:hypothetical protein